MIYEIISEFTDKGQFQFLLKLKGASRGDLPVYNTISFTKIKINIFFRKYLIPSWEHFIAPCKEVIIT